MTAPEHPLLAPMRYRYLPPCLTAGRRSLRVRLRHEDNSLLVLPFVPWWSARHRCGPATAESLSAIKGVLLTTARTFLLEV